MPLSMQVAASLIALPIDVANVMPPPTMAMPTTTRMSAYSAADAPDSSRMNDLRKLVMMFTPCIPRPVEILAGTDVRAPASISGWPASEEQDRNFMLLAFASPASAQFHFPRPLRMVKLFTGFSSGQSLTFNYFFTLIL